MRILLVLFLFVQIIYHVSSLAVMSIDLGSDFLKIAIVKPGVPMEIVLNKESRRKTPVAISLKTVEREFGEPAMSQAIKHPKTAYLNLKDLVGKSLDNPLVKIYQERYPYYTIKEDETTKTIYFQHDSETTYTPEELLAMMFEYSREIASDFAEQAIDAAVITVPPYFNQAERKAILRSAELANLKVLQLINANTAAALNYGVFRRKDFNANGTTIMFFDMGASGTTATVAHYQMVKTKDDIEANPQLTIKGVGFDRTLGGSEFTQRLMKHLANIFKKEKKKDVFQYPKAILKLQKEAERVKNVLSANADHFAQVEGLVDEIDFKTKVTREEFENLNSDLFERIRKPIDDAVKAAGVNFDEIENVILVGGGTRIPKVQDELLKITKKSELGKSLNTDEAPALGAVYQAAFQSKGYKVKKFYIKDANVYPLVVDFERHVSQTGEENAKENANKYIRRVLFDRNNGFPQKKIMTFNKHDTDFNFYLNYGDLTSFDKYTISCLGSLNVTHYELKGVQDVFAKHKDEQSKGIKVHFNMDDSGILAVDKADIIFEKPEDVKEEDEIGSKISSFFGGGSSADSGDGKVKDDDTPKATPKEEEKVFNTTESASREEEEGSSNTNSTNNDQKTDSNTEKDETPSKDESKETKDEKKPVDGESNVKVNQTTLNATDSGKNETKPKLTVLRETFEFTTESLDLNDVDEKFITEKRKRLDLIREKEREKRKRASAYNNLEAFIYDTKFKLQEPEFEKCSTSEERESLTKKLEEYNDWLSETDDSVGAKEITDKLKELKAATKDVYFRVNETKLRPRKLDELKEVLNASTYFLASARNLTGEDKPFTEIEVTALEKLINTTVDWRTKMLNEQAKVADYETPKLLSSDISEKMDALRREVSYLITKAKYFRPKPKKTTENVKSNTTKTTDDEKKQKEGSDADESTKEEHKSQEEQFSEEDAKNFEKLFDEQQEDETTKAPKRKAKPTAEETNTDEKLELDDGTSKKTDEEATPNPEL